MFLQVSRGTLRVVRAMGFDVELTRLLEISEGLCPPGTPSPAISVLSIRRDGDDTVSNGLEAIGFRLEKDAPFRVVEVDHYLQDRLHVVNLQSLSEGISWIPVCNAQTATWVGPLFTPAGGGCWNCLASRLKENGFKAAPFRTEIPVTSGYDPEALRRAGLCLVALLLNAIADCWQDPGKGLWCFEPGLGKFRRHVVVRREGCKSCPEPRELKDETMMPLEDRTPGKTWERLKHHISPLTGVVASIRPILSLRAHSLHLWQAEHAYLRRLSPDVPKFGERGKSVGKDQTELAAKLGALCEALERYSGLFRGDEIRIKTDLQSLGDRGIHPNSCMNFSRQQYRKRDFWNRTEADFNWIPLPFEEEQVIEWSPLRSLTGEDRFLPTGYCYYGYRSALDLPYFRPDSNGCAAGDTLAGAIFRGLMEVVERDAVAIWWYNQLRCPAVDLASFQNPFFSSVQDYYYRRLGRDLWVLDLTTDVEIPVFVAVSASSTEKHDDFTLGFGAHLSPEIAVSRALNEMSQFIPVLRAGRQNESWAYRGRLTQNQFLYPESVRSHLEREIPDQFSGDPEQDLDRAVGLLRNLGQQVFYLDQTRQDVGLYVVKVIVPGMRQIWPRFGPGRLYEVPERRGLLPSARKESAMNRAHLMI